MSKYIESLIILTDIKDAFEYGFCSKFTVTAYDGRLHKETCKGVKCTECFVSVHNKSIEKIIKNAQIS